MKRVKFHLLQYDKLELEAKKVRTDESCVLLLAFLQSQEALAVQKGQKKSSASTHTQACSGNKHYHT